jgi:hypothetical protein
LLKVLNEHYFEHPLASARKKLPRVRRAYSLASEPAGSPVAWFEIDEFVSQESAKPLF